MAGDFSLDSIKQNGFKNTVTYRGAGRNAGASYDYMDKLNQLVDKGIFVDKDGNGFTSGEKKALEDEFIKLHQEKGYNTNFRKMRAGTTNEYTYDDFIKLAQAAGYVLKEDAPQAKHKPEATEPDSLSEKAKADKVSNPVAEVKTPEAEQEEGNEPISQSGKQVANTIASTLPDGKYDITFKGAKVEDENGNIFSQHTKVTVITPDGSKKKVTVDGTPSHRPTVTEPDLVPAKAPADKATTPVAEVETPVVKEETPVTTPNKVEAPIVEEKKEEVKTPVSTTTETSNTGLNEDADFASLSYEEKLNRIRTMQADIKKDINDANQTSYSKTKKGFLGLGKKTKTVNYTPEEIAQRQANLPQLQAELEEAKKQETQIRELEGQYWFGKQATDYVINSDGSVDKRDTGYTRVETADGKRIAQVDTYNKDTHKFDTKYYNVKVAKTGNPSITSATNYQVVPDFDNELKDVKLKK